MAEAEKRWFHFDVFDIDRELDIVREWAADEETARQQAINHIAGTGLKLIPPGK
jgi:hypothetical protein